MYKFHIRIPTENRVFRPQTFGVYIRCLRKIFQLIKFSQHFAKASCELIFAWLLATLQNS